MTYISPAPMNKGEKLLIQLVKALAKAAAQRNHKRELSEIRKERKSDDPQGNLSLEDD